MIICTFRTRIILTSNKYIGGEAERKLLSQNSDYYSVGKEGEGRAGPSGVSQVSEIVNVFSRVVALWLFVFFKPMLVCYVYCFNSVQ